MKKFYTLALCACAMTGMAQSTPTEFIDLLKVSEASPATEADVIWTPQCVIDGHSYAYNFEVGVTGSARAGVRDVSYAVSNGQKGEIVADTYGDEYFIKNPLPRTAIGSYIKGVLVEEGDNLYIECKLPQWLNARESTNSGVRLSLATPERGEDGLMWYNPVTDEEQNVIRYVMDEDENFVFDAPEGTALVALYSYLDEELSTCIYAGASVTHVEYKDPGTKEVATIPDGVEETPWGMLYSNGDRAHQITGAIDGDKIYLKGVVPSLPGSCVVGTISGDKVVFDANQYLGETESTYEYLVFRHAEFVSSSDRGDVYDFSGDLLPSLEAVYEADSYTVSCPMDVAWFSNAGTDELYYQNFFVGPMFLPDKGGAATPCNPEITEVMDFMPEFGYGGFMADMPLLGTEGEVLDKNYYTYIVYFDGEPYTFEPELFPGVTEPMLEIPYDFEDGEAEDFRVEGTSHIICWRTAGFTSLGVQALYTVNGVTNRSEVVTYKLGDSSLDTVTALPQTVEFYDLAGRKILNPTSGMYVKRITYDNGKTETVKVVIK